MKTLLTAAAITLLVAGPALLLTGCGKEKSAYVLYDGRVVHCSGSILHNCGIELFRCENNEVVQCANNVVQLPTLGGTAR